MRWSEAMRARYERDAKARVSIDILALESSCDETAAAVVRDGRIVLSSVVASQISSHQRFGGVVPEVASRAHVEQVTVVIGQALADAQLTLGDVHAIAVTRGPGLIGALFVGVTAAKTLAQASGLPLIGVHHLAGHLYAAALSQDAEPPLLALVVSGGHTELLHVNAQGSIEQLGKTRDDAAGEAYDKVARALGLGYPGGPAIQDAAVDGDPAYMRFPRALPEENSLDFSFSGLKSAVMLHLDRERKAGRSIRVADVAASFQSAVTDALEKKALLALAGTGRQTLLLAGGVAANAHLRARLQTVCDDAGVRLIVPELRFCTDNAAMIGAAAYVRYKQGKLDDLTLTAQASIPIDQW
ncbi:MAG: tRNA (adenosine(37)-N6)-threonylcarbamoyltransferase complex transferase subunit TsaD [Bacilli bacterium]